MNQQCDIQPLLELTENLLRIAKADRDGYFDTVSLDDGSIPAEGDRALLAQMDALIGKAEALLFAYRTDARPWAYMSKGVAAIFSNPAGHRFTTHKPQRAPLWARIAKRWRRRQQLRMARMPAPWRPQA